VIRALSQGAGTLGERMRHFLLDPQGAEVALEFSSVAVTGVRIEVRRGQAELRSLVAEPLADGAFAPALSDPGFVDKEQLREALRRVLGRLGAPPSSRAALVVPDGVARFRLFPRAEMGVDSAKFDSVATFKMQKLLPFPASDTRVVSAVSASADHPVLAIGFSSAVLAAYEAAGQAFGLDVGSVETSSMALLPLLPAVGDALLVRHDPTWLTITLTRQGWPVSIRSFDATVARSPEETRHEIASTAVFWRDRLAGERLDAAIVHATDSWFETLAADTHALFGREPQRAKPPAGFTASGVPATVERSATAALALLAAGI
jgi:hypothetical protein